MSQEDYGWEEYYQKIKGRAPRQLVQDALAYFPQPSMPRYAIDLGCGDGTETVVLLERGWNVLAIDGEPAAIQHLMEKVLAEHNSRLQTQIAKFHEVVLSPADLIHASLSIPFCEPEHFPALWDKITDAVRSGGRFAGQFFGVRDSWAVNTDMIFHNEEQVRTMLKTFKIESFHEMDEDGNAVNGPKHWHVFTVIAKKK
jgi:trans-aconitate methyltransferase